MEGPITRDLVPGYHKNRSVGLVERKAIKQRIADSTLTLPGTLVRADLRISKKVTRRVKRVKNNKQALLRFQQEVIMKLLHLKICNEVSILLTNLLFIVINLC